MFGCGRGSFALLTNINASWGAQCSEKREEKRRRNRNHRRPTTTTPSPLFPTVIKEGARKEFLWAAKGEGGIEGGKKGTLSFEMYREKGKGGDSE